MATTTEAAARSLALLTDMAAMHPDLAGQFAEIVAAVREDIAAAVAAATAAASSASSQAVSNAPGSGPDASIVEVGAVRSARVAVRPAVAALPAPFITVRSISCVTPRGKHDIDICEGGITLRASASPAAGSSTASPSPPPVTVAAHNVTGVFALRVRDRYKTGPAALTHVFVITLANPIPIGVAGTLHSAVALSEGGAALAKAGAADVALIRDVTTTELQDATALPELQRTGGSGATPPLRAEHSFALLRRLFGAVFGAVGEADPAIFTSSKGDASVKCYHKVINKVIGSRAAPTTSLPQRNRRPPSSTSTARSPGV